VVTIRAGGEEKPEREEVVEPLEEPTPERHKERKEEKVPEEEPEKAPAREAVPKGVRGHVCHACAHGVRGAHPALPRRPLRSSLETPRKALSRLAWAHLKAVEPADFGDCDLCIDSLPLS
jgi:hypothetical protein